MSTTSSTVCQNLKSCLDPFPFEPLDLMHRSTPSKQALSFLRPQEQTVIESSKPEQAYVHPFAKHSSSSLSTISLDMCTESLCSETGNDVVSNPDDFSYHALEKKQSMIRNKPAKNQEFTKRITKFSNFPPPLTSISGDEVVQVQTRREGGRLVIRAFHFPSARNYFRAERENGRLKLSLIGDGLRDNEKEEEEEVEGGNVNEARKDYCENGSDDEADFNGRHWGENNLRDDGCKINGGDWSGGGRCNDERSRGSKRLPSLPYCVAIS